MRGRSILVVALVVVACVLTVATAVRRLFDARAPSASAAPAPDAVPSPPPATRGAASSRENLATDPPVSTARRARPAVDPAPLAKLRRLGAEVLETFELQRLPAAVHEHLGVTRRIAEVVREGGIDLGALRRLGPMLIGHEMELVAAVLQPALAPQHPFVVDVLDQLGTPAARRAIQELVQWNLARMATQEDVSHCNHLLQQLARSTPPPGAEEILPQALACLRSDLDGAQEGELIESFPEQIVGYVARAERPEALRAVRALLEDPDARVRAMAADGVIRALLERGDGPLVEALRPWAAGVVGRAPATVGSPRLAWLVHASQGPAALAALSSIQPREGGSWYEWAEDHRIRMRAIVRAAERAEPASARRALFALIEDVPPGLSTMVSEERKLTFEAIAHLGTDEDFEFLRARAAASEAEAWELLDPFPARLWKGHESVLRELVRGFADSRSDAHLVGYGLTALARLGVDPRAVTGGDPALERTLEGALRNGADSRAQDVLAARIDETRGLAPLERVRALAASYPEVEKARAEFIAAIGSIAREAAASTEAALLEEALLDPALDIVDIRLPLLAALVDGERADRGEILVRVLPLVLERECRVAAWRTLQAAATLAVLEGRAEREWVEGFLSGWDLCAPLVAHKKAPAAVALLREFLAEAAALGVDRLYDG